MEEVKCPRCGSNHIRFTKEGQRVLENAQDTSTAGVYLAELGVNALFGTDIDIPFKKRIANALATNVPIEHICLTCDCLFKVSNNGVTVNEHQPNRPMMPESIIRQEKEAYIAKKEAERPIGAVVTFAILASIFMIIFTVQVMGDFSFEEFTLMVFTFGGAIGMAIPLFIKLGRLSQINKEITKCKTQTLQEFKEDHPEIFAKYP